MLYDKEHIEILEPEGSDAKEVFTFFGLCSYNAQVLEEGLVNLAVGLRALKLTSLTMDDFESLFHKMHKMTFGQLMIDIRRYVNVSAELEEEIVAVLNDRNYLTHGFFRKHDIEFTSNRGRIKMIEELRWITERIRNVDHELELITHSLWERLGATQEMFQDELARMKVEAEQLDS